MKKITAVFSKKGILLTGVVVLLIGAGIVMLEATGHINLIKDKQPVTDKTTKTTSSEPSAQSDFRASETRKPEEPPTTSSQVMVDDTGATNVSSTNASITSKDGAITVYSPVSNSVFTSGSTLAGRTSASAVSYRLADNVSGVTATGTLKVVNGVFSGKFSFSTKATEGRLDVFQIGPGGVEQSIIEIPIRFR